MPRLARVVLEGEPHHVIQRGNRRQAVFFRPEDKVAYLRILGLQSKLFGLNVWAYCLMDNHVHLIVVPEKAESLVKAIGETHQLYTNAVNFREGWRGYLWQGRFKSVPLTGRHLYAAVRYVECNPVRAGLVRKAEEYEWSSARAHSYKIKNELLTRCFLEDEITDWRSYLAAAEKEEDLRTIRFHTNSGRPAGSEESLKDWEEKTGRKLIKQKPGPRAR